MNILSEVSKLSNHPNDAKIKDLLKAETDDIAYLKEPTWKNIQDELFPSQIKNPRKRRVGRLVAILSMAVITAVIWAGLTTTTGKALIQNLKDMFVPEKDIELRIEGGKEETHVELETNESLRYVIYVDKSRYKLIEGEASDKIVPNPALDDQYPEVSMEIIQKEVEEVEVIQDIKRELDDLDMELTDEEKIDTPFAGTKISAIGKSYTNEHGKTGTQWDTPVHRYYVTTKRSGQVFIVKQIYFLEAAEGHGARFNAMLETFEVVQ